MKTIIFASIFLLVRVAAFAATSYYVDTKGFDTNNGTSVTSPFATLSQAISNVVAGDFIYIRGGTYNLSSTILIQKNGAQGQMISVFAYQNEVPVLNFSAMAESSSNRGIVLDGHFWYFKNIIIEKAGDNGMLLAGNNNIIENCVFRGNKDTGLQLSRYNTNNNNISLWPSNNLILKCEAYDNSDSGHENADGFAAKLTCGTGNIFRQCVAHHNIDDGWDLYTKTETGPIGPITLESCIAHSNGILTDGSTSGNGDKNGFKLGGEDIQVNHILRRCIAYNNGKHGFTYNSNEGEIEVTNCTAYNNTERNFNFDQSAKAIFKNNLSFKTGSNDRIRGTATAPNAFDNDDTWTFTATSNDFVSLTPGANATPVNNGFLNLATSSSLINAGIITTGITYNGSAPDLGAIETGGPVTINPDPNSFAEIYCIPSIINEYTTVRIILPTSACTHVFVKNIMGQDVWRSEKLNLTPGENIIPIDFSQIKPGIYFVGMEKNNALLFQKVCKK